MGHDQPNVCVFAPTVFVTVTIEDTDDVEGDDIHFHPGGQGLWVARMLRQLGERPVLCSPLGGETGRVLRSLIGQWGIDMGPVDVRSPSPAYVDDRRSGERVNIARGVVGELDRHELDDIYGKILDHALSTGVAVITGRVSDVFPLEVYRRLGADLASTEVATVADIHGPELEAFLEGGPIRTLKVSDEDLDSDGRLDDLSEGSVLETMKRLQDRGASNVVVSRASLPTLARFGENTYQATTPEMEPVDFRGAGDSMTAALAAAVTRGYDVDATLRLATAAGAANVTRRGLGSASVDLIEQLSQRVEIASHLLTE